MAVLLNPPYRNISILKPVAFFRAGQVYLTPSAEAASDRAVLFGWIEVSTPSLKTRNEHLFAYNSLNECYCLFRNVALCLVDCVNSE